MFQFIKDKIATKAYQQLLKHALPIPIDKVKNVGLIVDLSIFKDPKYIKTLIRSFEAEYNQVKVILVTSSKATLDTGLGLHFDDSQMDWKGNFKVNSDANKFLQGHYDMLVNYYERASPTLLLLSAMLKANVKLGFDNKDNPTNNINIIANPDNIDKFMEAIKTYLPKIYI